MQKKKLSRREFLRLGGLTTAGVVLAGCGPTSTPTPETIIQTQIVKETEIVTEKEIVKETVEVPVAAPTTEPVTLTLWHHWGGDREPLLKKACDDFAARNPGVSVELTLIPWERKEETLLTAIAAGNAPDVLHLISTETPVYVNDEVLVPLDDYIATAGITAAELVDVDWQSGIINGKIWALPLNSSGADLMMFTNLKHYEEDRLDPTKPPATWDEMRDFAQKMTKLENGEITRLGAQIGASGWDWLYYIAQNDGTWLSADGREVLMDNPQCVEAMQYVVDIFDIQGGWEKVTGFLGIARQTEPFIADVVANYCSGQWVNYYILTGNPELKYGTAVAPKNQGQWTAESYGPQQWTIPTGNEHIDLAFALSLWLSRDDGGCNFLTPQVMPSAWKACNDRNQYALIADFWPTIEAAFASTRATVPTPVFNQFLSIWDEMMQKALLKDSTPQEAVTWATEEMVKTNDEYWAKHGG